MATRFQ